MWVNLITIVHDSHETTLVNDAMIIVQKASEQDYFNLANEDLKVEFDGECLYIHSPATKKHEKLNHKLITLIDAYLINNPSFGEVIGSRFALKLPNGKRPEPDLVIVPPNKVKDNDSVYEGIPRTVIELTSPSTRKHDLGEKLSWYKEAKIPEILIIDTEDKVLLSYCYNEISAIYDVYSQSSGEYSMKIIPGLALKISDLF